MSSVIKLALSVLSCIVPYEMYEMYDDPSKHLEKSSFEKTVSQKYYADKTLLIKEFIEDKNRVVLVTTPFGFGKSVNIDMLKTFLSIQTDVNGNEIQNKTNTKNYKLFTSLKIFKQHRELFDVHFGKYPIIYIDYSPLAEITSYEDMIDKLRKVQRNTYLHHYYLPRVGNVTTWKPTNKSVLDVGDFRDYTSPSRNKKLEEAVLEDGFDYLCELLYTNFKRKIIVLIDDYNAHMESFIFEECEDMERIMYFFESIHRRLLENEIVVKVLLTGMLNVRDRGFSSRESVITRLPFLRNHRYSQFYGLSGSEVRKLLIQHTHGNRTETAQLKQRVITFYNGYTKLVTNAKVFSTYLVIQYLGGRSSQNYKAKRRYIGYISRLLYNQDLKVQIITLLQNGTKTVNISDGLCNEDILALSKSTIVTQEKNTNLIEKPVFKLLFELGYLTKDSGSNQSGLNSLKVRLPNLEIDIELAKTIKLSVICQYNLNVHCIDNLNDIIDSISKHNKNEEIFKAVREKLSCVFHRSSYAPQDENDFQSVLFSVFRDRFSHTYTQVRSTEKGELDIWLRNNNEFLFIIQTKIVEAKQLLRNCTESVIGHIVREGYVKVLKAALQRSVVYLGICYSTRDKLVGLASSTPINVDGDLYENSFFIKN